MNEAIIFHRDGRVSAAGEDVGRWQRNGRAWLFKAWDSAYRVFPTQFMMRAAAADAWCRWRTRRR